jgi:hypothetical protein
MGQPLHCIAAWVACETCAAAVDLVAGWTAGKVTYGVAWVGAQRVSKGVPSLPLSRRCGIDTSGVCCLI